VLKKVAKTIGIPTKINSTEVYKTLSLKDPNSFVIIKMKTMHKKMVSAFFLRYLYNGFKYKIFSVCSDSCCQEKYNNK